MIVCVDETWVKTNMTHARGLSLRDTTLLAKVPHRHRKTLTFLAGLRHDSIFAPCVIDGPINGAPFTAWVDQFLAPTLSRGDVVVADNLGSHKGKAARNAIRAVGAKLFFLPASSPDLNPIEMVFAKLKALLRKADERSIKATRREKRRPASRIQRRRMRRLPSPRRLRFYTILEDSRVGLSALTATRPAVWPVAQDLGVSDVGTPAALVHLHAFGLGRKA